MLIAIVMALIDVYPNPGPGLPTIPNFQDQLQVRARDLFITAACFAAGVWALSLILPKTALFKQLTSTTASGVAADSLLEQTNTARLGREGMTTSPLRPGGKAKFGGDVLDVVSQGELVPANSKVRIIGFSGSDPLVEVIG
jgi:membrane-bound serine protease (ClpP class)